MRTAVRSFLYTFALLSLGVAINVTARALAQQTTTDVEVALTTTVSNPEVLAIPASLELNGLDSRRVEAPAARLCYDYFRQSGAYSRTVCRAITGTELNDPTSSQSFLDLIAPRTATAQSADDHRRLMNRLRIWTENNGGPPEPPTPTGTQGARPTTTRRR